MENKSENERGTSFPLTNLYLYLTNNCNLHCGHCWISPVFDTSPQAGIPVAALKKTIIEAKELGLGCVKFTGGEPFLYTSIIELIHFLKSQEISITIETNGTLVTKEIVEALKAADVNIISISLDAATPSIHDELRGVKGSFSRAVEGIKLLTKEDFELQIIMTIQKKNEKEIPGVIDLCRKYDIPSLKINPMQPCGRAVDSYEKNLQIDLEDLLKLHKETLNLSPNNDPIIYFDLPNAFLSIEEMMRINSPQCNIFNILGILANGDYSICGIGEAYSELRMGNIFNDSIADIWQNDKVLNDLRESLPHSLKGICGQCIFKAHCLGACRANAYSLTEDLYAPYFICQDLFEKGLFPSSRQMEQTG